MGCQPGAVDVDVDGWLGGSTTQASREHLGLEEAGTRALSAAGPPRGDLASHSVPPLLAEGPWVWPELMLVLVMYWWCCVHTTHGREHHAVNVRMLLIGVDCASR